ncbi:hypothetical protein G7Z17_g5300 [Cylindrodendrum hubeiense]|uniref:Uncharacterized protein n=1 Tax=Cylindrodendrum hubeiense TaxID=595255 RepID=A0A9P5H971_9HYPO|nr:hypothetical protein G7Z17_g5300 [Cylindrodendrum hubeiense]
MRRSMFIAAENSRHRVAMIALYRALIKSGNKIALPQNLQPSGPVHPIVHLIRKRVRKNKTYTSLRLIYAAMAAGYKFLTMFTKAQNPKSSEYAMIVNHLRKRADEAALSRSKLPPRKQHKRWEKNNPPLLIKISDPTEPPEYISTVRPRPKSDFNGERKVPVFTATTEGLPFLRTRKPQPRILSKIIGKKQRVLRKRIYSIVDINEEHMPAAEQEDNWDRLVRKELRAAGLEEEGPPEGPFGTYQRSQVLSRLWYMAQLDTTWNDWIARGRALGQIAEQERTLAEEEKRIADGTQEVAAAAQVVEETTDPVTAKMLENKRDATPSPIPVADPFLAPRWQAIVERNENKLLPRNGPDPRAKTGRGGDTARHGKDNAQTKDRNQTLPSDDFDIDSALDAFGTLALKRKVS